MTAPTLRQVKNSPDNLLSGAFDTVQSMTAEVIRAVEIPDDELRAVIGAAATGEYVLFEGVPGTGKTTLAKSLAAALGGSYRRVQGTPDVTPSDITGNYVYSPKTGEYEFKPGPVFSNVVLLDEVNRLQPKSQSALLEAMQEKQVTVGNETYSLPSPFFVLATQNPHEIGQGVNPLTNANRDRFAIGITMPELSEDEMLAVEAKVEAAHKPTQVVEIDALNNVRSALTHMAIASSIKRDAAELVVAVREHKDLSSEETVLGGARPLLRILNLARYAGMSDRRQKVEVADIAFAARYVLPHRVGLHFDQYNKTTAHEIVEQVISKSL